MGLQQWLAEEEERKKPEFLKQRPKYHYYYEWMKQRICATHPALPEPVMDKLLTMPANDLDLILQHKEGTTWKVICTNCVACTPVACYVADLVKFKLTAHRFAANSHPKIA